MKLILIFALFSVIVAQTLAWLENCRGEPVVQHVCNARVDHGHQRIAWCQKRAMSSMWYYNRAHGTCLTMQYFGCGGNGNRYCTKQECMDACVRD
ncbi:hypothetical protein ACLKA7_016550 [Drosophila subpalustris]